MGRGASKPGKHKRWRRPGAKIATETTRPNDWDMSVSGAYLRLLGATQKQTAKNVGVSHRTVQSWEASNWWPRAEAEARTRWLKGGDSMAMSSLLRAMRSEDDASTARWWAERRLDGFVPPKRQFEHSGPGGSPIQISAAQMHNLSDDEITLLETISAKLLTDGDLKPQP